MTGLETMRVVTREPAIYIVAGNGTAGFSSDYGPAVCAQLNYPRKVAVDSSGNLFFSDYSNHRVRRVDAATQQITTVAGNGTAGFNGDNQPAVYSRLHYPRGVAVDAGGNLFIADCNNHRVRRVDAATRQITTVAGTGIAGFNGDNQPAVNAQLNSPIGVAVDAGGNLFITDFNNQRVRRVDAATRQITTVAGTGTAGFNGDNQSAVNAQLYGPVGVAADAGGNLFIGDYANHRVRRVDAATRQITTVAGTGIAGFNGDNQPAVNAQLNAPHTVAVDSGGNVFIADTSNHRVRRVDAATRQITTVAGIGTAGFNGDGGPAIGVQLNSPVGVAVDSGGGLFIADASNYRVRKVSDVASTARFSVAPGGPPDVRLERAGNTGYPGVQVRAEDDGTIAPQNVRVDLPAGVGLQFVGEPRYTLTVLPAAGTSRSYYGTVSPDGQSLTFDNVDLALSGRDSVSAVWVAVKAPAGARLGDTRLTFRIGDRLSDSTTIRVEEPPPA
ncbi:NHL repeat-containing protein [Streptomyces viridochromogenes DSM 40736]|uniref:NHL repeat-containing protein n=1 Tax=Streptomyces viridochromogenes (strain DSM 40736 / JCM 4977 / BCRC 1201 / Tue 494) TaxID=591159 RepID=D9X541_STRVT|nr:NHL repeat-containing protein [Streptomyces viridochromogenes]EFL31779.1 NHL repeat-containing protein [Streptomyces viridochromogenes DSM 40736]